jgi:hypothetical protein
MSGEYKNVVGYSPTDFFYVSALDSRDAWNLDCGNVEALQKDAIDTANVMNIDSNIVINMYKDICANKNLVDSWTNHKINHSGSEQGLQDSQTTFNATLLNTVNLVVGIGFVTWAISSGWVTKV